MDEPHEITQCLRRLSKGDPSALERVVGLLYDELRVLARSQLRNERSGHTLGKTALVNELYLRLAKQERIEVEDRPQFFKVAATTMRRLLVDHARARRRLKRGAGEISIPLDEIEGILGEEEAEEVIALDEALERMSRVNPRGAEVVQQRFFVGMSLEETAEILGVSPKTVWRDWIAARAWLRKEVRGEEP